MKTKNFCHHLRRPTMGLMPVSFLLLAAAVAIAHPRVAIRFAPDNRLSPLAVVTAIREAADLWSPHGVAVESAGATGEGMMITVAVGTSVANGMRVCPRAECRAPGKGASEALAAVTFVNGRPTASIAIFLDEIVRLVEHGRPAGTAAWQWPRSMRERIIGRALGRVVAHEIGHIVLESKQHTPMGLMRANHGAADLIEPGRHSVLIDGPYTKTDGK
jgi:hypothetical protein